MKFLKRILFVVAALLTLTALFYAVENWRGTRDYQKSMERLHAKGEELEFAKLTPPIVPNDDNFGSAPFLQSPEQEGAPGSEQALMTEIHDSLIDLQEAETAEDFLAIAKRLADDDGTTTDPMEFLRTTLERWNPIRHGLVVRLPMTHARWNQTFESGQRVDSYTVLKNANMDLMRLNTIQARVHLLENDNDAALEDILIGLRLGEMYCQEPGWIFHVFFLANLALVGEPLEQGLRTQAFNKGHLVQLDQKLGELHYSNILESVMRGERAYAMTFIDSATETLRLESMVEQPDSWLLLAPKGWGLRGFGILCDAYQESAEIFGDRNLSLGAQWQSWQEVWEPHQEAFRPTEWVVGVNAMKSTGIMGANLDSARKNAIFRAAIQINNFKLKNERFPATLNELTPVPLDPLDDQPLLYEQTAKGFIIETSNDSAGFPIRFESH